MASARLGARVAMRKSSMAARVALDTCTWRRTRRAILGLLTPGIAAFFHVFTFALKQKGGLRNQAISLKCGWTSVGPRVLFASRRL